MKSGPIQGPRESQDIHRSEQPGKGQPSLTKDQAVQKLQDLLENLLAKTKKGDEAEKGGQASPSDKKQNAEDKELLKLLMKLLKGDITPQEMEKLGKLLGKMGIKPEDMNQAKGAGTENDV